MLVFLLGTTIILAFVLFCLVLIAIGDIVFGLDPEDTVLSIALIFCLGLMSFPVGWVVANKLLQGVAG